MSKQRGAGAGPANPQHSSDQRRVQKSGLAEASFFCSVGLRGACQNETCWSHYPTMSTRDWPQYRPNGDGNDEITCLRVGVAYSRRLLRTVLCKHYSGLDSAGSGVPWKVSNHQTHQDCLCCSGSHRGPALRSIAGRDDASRFPIPSLFSSATTCSWGTFCHLGPGRSECTEIATPVPKST